MINRGTVLLTFDDRTVDHWFAHRGLWLDTGARVTFFVSHPDGLSGAESEQLRVLAADGHTIAVHGMRHLDAPAHLAEPGQDQESYLAEEIAPAIAELRRQGLGTRDFAYPYGRRNAETDALLTRQFSWVRATGARTHDLDEAAEALFDPNDAASGRVVPARGIDVGRRGELNPDDSAILDALLDLTARHGRTLCLYGHDIDSVEGGLAGGRNFVTPQRIREIVSAATDRGLALLPFAALPD